MSRISQKPAKARLSKVESHYIENVLKIPLSAFNYNEIYLDNEIVGTPEQQAKAKSIIDKINVIKTNAVALAKEVSKNPLAVRVAENQSDVSFDTIFSKPAQNAAQIEMVFEKHGKTRATKKELEDYAKAHPEIEKEAPVAGSTAAEV